MQINHGDDTPSKDTPLQQREPSSEDGQQTRRPKPKPDTSPIKMILRFCAQFTKIKKMYEYVCQCQDGYVCIKVAAAQRFVCRPRVRRDFFLMQINV